jgi:hypothetical protein
MSPSGSAVTRTVCVHFVEGDANLANHSRVVNIAADGTVPIMRADPVAGGSDNHRRIAIADLPKRLVGGEGTDRQSARRVSFVQTGQGVVTKERDGSEVQWVVSSEQLGEPVRGEDGRLAYQDRCFRNARLGGHDSEGTIPPGEQLSATCTIETMASESNYSGLLVNFATLEVPMANDPNSSPHPDGAYYVGWNGSAHVYTGYGAALNDINATERDEYTNYIIGEAYCHYVVSGGYEVPGAKRPATRSLPAPGSIIVTSYIQWRPVNPYIPIAN